MSDSKYDCARSTAERNIRELRCIMVCLITVIPVAMFMVLVLLIGWLL